MKPKVSIICLAYNHGKYIKQTLDGFLMQKTDFVIEILIHDDASTDGTAAIIRSYIKNNKKARINFKPIYETENQYSKGPYDFINDMFRSAEGEYIAYCEGDDYWTDPNKLQKQVNYMDKHPSVTLCFHRVQAIYQDSNKKAYTVPASDEHDGFTIKELIQRNYIQLNSVLYRVQNYKNMPNTLMPQDWYLHLYHAKFGKIGFIDEIMAVYRINAGGIWHDSHEQIDKIWRRFGVRWLALYIEMFKMFGENTEYKKIIEGSIVTSFVTLTRIDEQYGDKLLVEALKTFPDYTTLYIENLREQVKQLDEHSKKQAEIIEHYVKLNVALERDNKRLMGHPVVRLTNGLKRRAKQVLKTESRKG